MSDIVERLMDGSLEVTVEFPDMTAWADPYDQYDLRRKEIEFPVDETDGISVDTDAIPLGGVTVTVPDVDMQDGVVYYYAIFAHRSLAGTYELWKRGFSMGLVPSFDEISSAFVPQALRREYEVADSSNPLVLQQCFLDPVFGEAEALIRNMGINWDVDWADPHALSNLVRVLNWWLSPIMRLSDFRTQVKALTSSYWNKGQYVTEHDLLEDISQLPMEIEEWHDNMTVTNDDEAQTCFENTIIGIGNGVNDTFNYNGDFEILPFSVSITDGTTIIVDTNGDGVLYVEGTATVAGSVTYATGVVSVVFPAGLIPALGDAVWLYYDFRKGFFDLDDPETQTRLGYLGDRCLYWVSQVKDSRMSGVALSAYFYLHVEVGEEGVFTFDGSYDKVYVDDIERKVRVIWPRFGNTEWVFVDRSVITFDIEDYAGHLPIEQVAEMQEE